MSEKLDPRALPDPAADATSGGRIRLTILCPCYNEEAVVPLFFNRLLPVIKGLSAEYDVHVVFLNNASTDNTLSQIISLREDWSQVYVVTFSRNVGYQRSVEGGLRNSDSDLYVIIDVDCEDPPELIPLFLEKFEQGFDIAYGERVDREEPAPIKAARKLFYRVLRRLADEEIILDMAEFALFTREVRDAIVQDKDSFPFIRSSIGRVGFRRIGIPFKRQQRIGGKTHYNFAAMLVFAIAGLLSASTLMLRLPIYIFPFWLAVLVALGIGFALTGAGWAAVAAMLLFAAYVGLTLAFMSLYVARSYKNSLSRPNAFIDRRMSRLPPKERSAAETQVDQ
ncbi:MAG: glycosyltransferase [Xanthobacteraceae bacterium]